MWGWVVILLHTTPHHYPHPSPIFDVVPSRCGAGLRRTRATPAARAASPLLARYDWPRARWPWQARLLRSRAPSMWRYRELLPCFARRAARHARRGLGRRCCTRARLGAAGAQRLYIKDESLNPTNSFKARGLRPRSRWRSAGRDALAVPSAGNAGGALAAYAARAGDGPTCSCPRRRRSSTSSSASCRARTCTLVDGLINDCGRIVARRGWPGLVRRVHPQGAVPPRGQEDDGLRAGRAARLELPDVILYPTGGGTGLIGMWKAFEEMEALGWLAAARRPRMVSVQAEGCAPIVQAFERGRGDAEPWKDAHTVADGLRVPRRSAIS